MSTQQKWHPVVHIKAADGGEWFAIQKETLPTREAAEAFSATRRSSYFRQCTVGAWLEEITVEEVAIRLTREDREGLKELREHVQAHVPRGLSPLAILRGLKVLGRLL